MKVLNLRCPSDHRFEGWFASEDDYRSQTERALIECPMCGDTTVQRLPSAPHVLTSTSRAEAHTQPVKPRQAQPRPGSDTESAAAGTPAADAQPDQFMLQSAWLRAVQHVIEATGMDCTGLVDEPSAANAVLQLRDGVVVATGSFR